MILRLPASYAGRSRALAMVAIASIIVPAMILWPRQSTQRSARVNVGTITPSPIPGEPATPRSLFLTPLASLNASVPADSPVLTGIAGRLPHDAIAMIRNDNGTTRVLAIGQTHQGWRLESLSSDAALFSRGSRKIRVALPTNDDGPSGEHPPS